MNQYIVEPERKVSVRDKFDTIVVGGGPAGIGAAISAASNGAKTLLLERYGFLGGMFTTGLVIGIHTDKLIPIEKYNEKKPLIGGISQQLLERLIEIGGAVDPFIWIKHTKIRSNYIPSDPELLKIAALEMVKESGASMLFHSYVVGAIVEDNMVKGVIIESKSGREALLSDVVIDATGDGDIAASAGAPYEIASGKMLPITLMVILGNVDLEKAKEYYPGSEALKNVWNKALSEGFLKDAVLPERPVSPTFPIRFVYLPPDEMAKYWQRANETFGWATHYKGDCTDVMDLTKAEIETREKLIPMIMFLRRHIPGFEKCYLAATGTQVGTRESRRIVGEYVLTAKDDISHGSKHSDVICRSRRNRGESIQDADPAFDIPYRCLVPKNINGLLVAGRCISIDHTAGYIIAIRDGIQSVGLGQAAGTAAALSSQKKVQPRELDITLLQKVLVSQGMNLWE